jgi:hypothetical protein
MGEYLGRAGSSSDLRVERAIAGRGVTMAKACTAEKSGTQRRLEEELEPQKVVETFHIRTQQRIQAFRAIWLRRCPPVFYLLIKKAVPI